MTRYEMQQGIRYLFKGFGWLDSLPDVQEIEQAHPEQGACFRID